MIPAAEALKRLRDGNRRFVAGKAGRGGAADPDRRQQLLDGQRPFAIVLGCSDSRVPAEIVFDQGLGDLFVIRVAGNIVAPSQIGSVEFAASEFGTRLVVVMGHTCCGAVRATLDELAKPRGMKSPNLAAIVRRVRPAVYPLLAQRLGERLEGEAVRANVRYSAEQLRHGSAIIERLIREDGLQVVGAEYSIETGEVTYLDDAATDDR